MSERPPLPSAISLRALGDLLPYAANSRTHNDAQVAQIAGSMREFGFTNPVLIDGDGTIIAGHGRVLAAQLLGLAEVPCIVLAHLSPAQRRAYVIADNKLAENAGWDEKMLALEIAELAAGGFDLDLAGFGEVERADLELRLSDPEPEPSPAPAPEDDAMVLRWGQVRIPITAEQKAALNARLESHLKAFGAPYGFVREGLGLGSAE